MRSRSSLKRVWLLCVCVVGLQMFTTTVFAQETSSDPTDQEVAAAVEKLRADPNLAPERKTRTLRWINDDEPPPKPSGFFKWIRNFFVWLGQISRALVWVLGALLAIALVWIVLRMFRHVQSSQIRTTELLPTHVRDLDIRPESLPDDIGAAALDLWQRGEHRAALALLYRGLLSRLVHVHAVPIRDASTEGDCLALATKLLPDDRKHYVARLIRTWQQATYGGRDADEAAVRELCGGFDAALAPVQVRAESRA